VPPASLSSSIIGVYYAHLVLSYSNLTRASSSFSIICAYCAPLVLSYKQCKPVLLCLSDMRHDGWQVVRPNHLVVKIIGNDHVPALGHFGLIRAHQNFLVLELDLADRNGFMSSFILPPSPRVNRPSFIADYTYHQK
jgi:hypothetical protein